jgi:hypothetical protein
MKMILLFSLLVCILGMAIGCSSPVDIKIKNGLSSDAKIMYSYYKQDGLPTVSRMSDTMRPGQSGTLPTGISTNDSTISKVVIQAIDATGGILWEKTWTGEEFNKLLKSGQPSVLIGS